MKKKSAYISVTSVETNKEYVIIKFESSKSLGKYFNSHVFTYACDSCEIVPLSILVIPFICNVLPIIWLTNSELIVSELDENFYQSIDEFKKGYVSMLPSLSFEGNLKINKLIKNKHNGEKNLVLFSGGVDAICTLLRHKKEDIRLLTLWGSADYPVNDIKGWQLHWENIKKNASILSVPCDYIQTNFCDFIPLWGNELRKLVNKANVGWWHDLQHGIGIIGHAAPYAYIHKIKTVYIASSYDESRKPYTCASDPTIDNYVKFGSTNVCHDGFELTRQDKIHYITTELNKINVKLNIHVCLKQYQTKNCCHCEKCYRTILGLYAEGESPQKWGFDFDTNDIERMVNDLTNKIILKNDKIILYKKIQEKFVENKNMIQEKELYDWFTNVNLNKINYNFLSLYRIIKYKCRDILRILNLKK